MYSLLPDRRAMGITLATDTTITIQSILYTNTAVRFPDITFIWSHGGGTMPYITSRFGAANGPDGKPNATLAVIQRFRGHNIGQLLLERARKLAESRGCNMLYAQVLPADVKYWEKQGWRRLVAEDASTGDKRIVAVVRAVDPIKPLPEVEAPESVVLRREGQLDASGLPLGSASN